MSRNAEFYDYYGPQIPLEYKYSADRTRHLIEAHHEGEKVGHLEWQRKTGVILHVEVDPAYRRMGVATGMMTEARRAAGDRRGVPLPKHSADRTDAGDAWARTVGGFVPKRSK